MVSLSPSFYQELVFCSQPRVDEKIYLESGITSGDFKRISSGKKVGLGLRVMDRGCQLAPRGHRLSRA